MASEGDNFVLDKLETASSFLGRRALFVFTNFDALVAVAVVVVVVAVVVESGP